MADPRMAGVMAEVFAGRGVGALVVPRRRRAGRADHADDRRRSGSWRDGAVTEQLLDPADLGIPPSPVEALRGGDAAFNASVARAVLAGQTGPVRDAVLLNAAAALVAAGVGEPARPWRAA